MAQSAVGVADIDELLKLRLQPLVEQVAQLNANIESLQDSLADGVAKPPTTTFFSNDLKTPDVTADRPGFIRRPTQTFDERYSA